MLHLNSNLKFENNEMITPRFNLTQDASFLTINIRAPYCNLKELDISIEEDKFIFACAPYYLRLNLPGNILDNERAKSSFDSDIGEFTFTYEKENDGEEFPNLDFITTFLQPKTIDVYESGRKIEVLTSESHPLDNNHTCEKKYGFALRGGYNFQNITSEFSDIFDIDPYEIKFKDREGLRLANEQAKFDQEHYIADIMDDSEINELIKLTCPWKDIKESDVKFTPKELDFLKDLPNIVYNLTTEQTNFCHYSLMEILFAYCYDRRTTFYEGTCESDWTISKLTASFCYFDSFSNPKSAIICAYKRSLIYPLYRSFKLCQKVFEDLKLLLKLGNKYIIHCLIDIHDIFLHGSNGRYILNKLFINDYIVYMMKCDLDMWKASIDIISKVEINKSDLGLNLVEIEKSINNTELVEAFTNLQVEDCSDDSDDTTESDSESSSETETSDSDCSVIDTNSRKVEKDLNKII